jgi:predicted glutamine amidotransferase
LIHQSFDAREIEEPLNGDGFGVGWYMPELDPEPGSFVSVHPAWSNRNLRSLSPKIKSGCLFAHVRAASFGDISEANCHPFHYGKFLMMHNGSIEGFDKIKRTIRRRLSDDVYSWIRGQTDSEHFFAIFIEEMKVLGSDYSLADMAKALERAINTVEALKRDAGIEDGTYLNTVVTDGTFMIGTRLVTTEEEPLTLYFSEGSRYFCEDGICRMEKAKPGEHSVLIVSEKLTEVRSDWKKVPANHMILIDAEAQVTFAPITINKRFKAAS